MHALAVIAGMMFFGAPSQEVHTMPTPPAERCVESLRALAEGRFAEFAGLSTDCVRAHAEAAFGSTGDAPDGSAMLGGRLASFRAYPAQPAAPHGLRVWYGGDRILAVEIDDPVLTGAVADVLGEPEAKEQSGLGPSKLQWIYASRGLALHVSRTGGHVVQLFAFQPATVEQYLNSSVARVEVRRIPLRSR